MKISYSGNVTSFTQCLVNFSLRFEKRSRIKKHKLFKEPAKIHCQSKEKLGESFGILLLPIKVITYILKKKTHFCFTQKLKKDKNSRALTILYNSNIVCEIVVLFISIKIHHNLHAT